jgi:hypothetical protein
MIMEVIPATEILEHPLDKIFACLPVGREAILPDRPTSPTLQ